MLKISMNSIIIIIDYSAASLFLGGNVTAAVSLAAAQVAGTVVPSGTTLL